MTTNQSRTFTGGNPKVWMGVPIHCLIAKSVTIYSLWITWRWDSMHKYHLKNNAWRNTQYGNWNNNS